MRKVDIRNRFMVLNERLRTKRDTARAQEDERRRLVDACRQAGDHVFAMVLVSLDPPDIAEVCEFCGVQHGATPQQVLRNLVRA